MTDKEKDFAKRKPTRLKTFDYSTAAAYFLTICTSERREILSEIVGDDVLGVPGKPSRDVGDDVLGVPGKPSRNVGDDVLSVPNTPIVPGNVKLLPCGEIANKYIIQLNDFYENIHVDTYVIMPNHIHILLWIGNNGTPRTSSPTRQTSTVSHFVSTFKRFCNKEYGTNIWQRGFYDHVVRCGEDCDDIKRYIYENPINWYYDELHSGNAK